MEAPAVAKDEDSLAIMEQAAGKRIERDNYSRACDAIIAYFKAHPEAGDRIPYFHHRAGLVAVVARALTQPVK